MSGWLKIVLEEASEQVNRLPAWLRETDGEVPDQNLQAKAASESSLDKSEEDEERR